MDFMLSEKNKDSVIIVVPAKLPDKDLVVYVGEQYLTFAQGDQLLADVIYQGGKVRRRLLANKQVGLFENVPGRKPEITNIATVREGNPPSLRE